MDADELKKRAKVFGIRALRFCKTLGNTPEAWLLRKQLGGAASSVGSNYRAACRGRSDREFYSKLCIVVEEADESVYWLDVIPEVLNCDRAEQAWLADEAGQLLAIFSASKKTIGRRLGDE